MIVAACGQCATEMAREVVVVPSMAGRWVQLILCPGCRRDLGLVPVPWRKRRPARRED